MSVIVNDSVHQITHWPALAKHRKSQTSRAEVSIPINHVATGEAQPGTYDTMLGANAITFFGNLSCFNVTSRPHSESMMSWVTYWEYRNNMKAALSSKSGNYRLTDITVCLTETQISSTGASCLEDSGAKRYPGPNLA